MATEVLVLTGLAYVAARNLYFLQRFLHVRPTPRQACRISILTVLALPPLLFALATTGALNARSQVILGLTLTALLISLYDLRLLLIPDHLTVNVGLCGVLLHLGAGTPGLLDALAGGLLGGALLGGLYLLYPLLRGVEGLGLGDVKLAVAIGLGLGPAGTPLAIAVGSLATLILVLLQRARGGHDVGQRIAIRRTPGKTRIPFAPGLLAGAISCLLLGTT